LPSLRWGFSPDLPKFASTLQHVSHNSPHASMKLISALTLFSTLALSAADNPKPATPAESVAPTTLEGRAQKPRRLLISSELNGRELQFITSALDVRGTLVYLARQTAESKNPTLKKLGQEIQDTLPTQTAVLTTLAEMRKVSIPEDSSRQQNIARKLADVKGARFEKVLLDALLDTNQELVKTCEAGLQSSDKSVKQFAEQTLPYAQGTLARVQAMAGIAPRRTQATAATAAKASNPKPAQSGPKPGFRANVPAVGSNE
jgi:predicted outer membrane protein